jgi:hypothetical protein
MLLHFESAKRESPVCPDASAGWETGTPRKAGLRAQRWHRMLEKFIPHGIGDILPYLRRVAYLALPVMLPAAVAREG